MQPTFSNEMKVLQVLMIEEEQPRQGNVVILLPLSKQGHEDCSFTLLMLLSVCHISPSQRFQDKVIQNTGSSVPCALKQQQGVPGWHTQLQKNADLKSLVFTPTFI